MAKLENVRIIDMVDGAIAKITYNGAEYAKVDGELAVGDFVRVIDAEEIEDVTLGAFYNVYRHSDEALSFDDDDGDDRSAKLWFTEGALELFRKVSAPSIEERISELERKVDGLTNGEITLNRGMGIVTIEPAKLKVGDYAKVIKSDNEVYLGLVVKLTKKWDYEERFNVTSIKKSGIASCAVGQMIRATDEEIAESKRSQSEAIELARWSKIGRKPNEFKKGDIIRVESEDNYDEIIGEVEDANEYAEGNIIGIREFGGTYRVPFITTVKLITPVEARFDVE